MAKYVKLLPTVTTTSLTLAKSSITSSTTTPVLVYTTPYHKLLRPLHISVLIHKLRTAYSTSLLPHLVGRTITPRGTLPHYHIAGYKIPASMTILSVTSSGIIKYFGYTHTGKYVGTSYKVTSIHTYTSTISITKLIKMLKSGAYTLL